MPGGEDCLRGGEGGLAPLAGAVEENELRPGREEIGLDGVGTKGEAILGEADGVEGVTDIEERGHFTGRIHFTSPIHSGSSAWIARRA